MLVYILRKQPASNNTIPSDVVKDTASASYVNGRPVWDDIGANPELEKCPPNLCRCRISKSNKCPMRRASCTKNLKNRKPVMMTETWEAAYVRQEMHRTKHCTTN